MQAFAESIAPKVPDPDDNADAYNHPPTGKSSGDPRDKKSTYDLWKVDYPWVDKQTSKRELKHAYMALKEDGGFPDLLKHVLKKLKSLDPNFKTEADFNNYTPQDAEDANNDVMAFLDEMNETDKKIRGDGANGSKSQGKEIFADSRSAVREQTEEQKDFITSLENKRSAEDRRYRGNEHMKAKEYQEAVDAYSKSIELNSSEAATYCNRAMAYLRMKNYARCIEDADKTLEMEPDYVKAYHRRGKAYLATNKFELAIRDFQFILEKNPDDKDINASLKSAREKQEEREERAPKTVEITEEDTAAAEPAAPAQKKGGFKRVSIIEDDDDSEEEEEAPKDTAADTASSEDKENSSSKENAKPLI